MIKTLNVSCQGDSHKSTDKPCQDYSYSYTSDDLTIAIVCDGHGGERYFRSDVGARLCAEVICQCVETFVKDIDASLFVGKTFTQRGVDFHVEEMTATDNAFRQLFSSIIYNWVKQINEHASTIELTEWERTHVAEKYLEGFLADNALEKTYGCTLVCYVRTTNYWFAFHIGDGKCIAFEEQNTWFEPIPWDDRCFLNKTTSICDSDAINEFRYCFCGDGTFPFVIFLGSDGIDDSFGETENMVNFYVQLAKMLVKDGYDSTLSSLEETLPQLSKIGSKDDMSIACVYDDVVLSRNVVSLIEWQKRNIENKIASLEQRKSKLVTDIESFDNMEVLSQSEAIEKDYAVKELTRVIATINDLSAKRYKFVKEIRVLTHPMYS